MYEKPEWILFDEEEIEKLKRRYGMQKNNFINYANEFSEKEE